MRKIVTFKNESQFVLHFFCECEAIPPSHAQLDTIARIFAVSFANGLQGIGQLSWKYLIFNTHRHYFLLWNAPPETGDQDLAHQLRKDFQLAAGFEEWDGNWGL